MAGNAAHAQPSRILQFGWEDTTVRWCDRPNVAAARIVATDLNERTPRERAAMLRRLGIRHLIWDWRDRRRPAVRCRTRRTPQPRRDPLAASWCSNPSRAPSTLTFGSSSPKPPAAAWRPISGSPWRRAKRAPTLSACGRPPTTWSRSRASPPTTACACSSPMRRASLASRATSSPWSRPSPSAASTTSASPTSSSTATPTSRTSPSTSRSCSRTSWPSRSTAWIPTPRPPGASSCPMARGALTARSRTSSPPQDGAASS